MKLDDWSTAQQLLTSDASAWPAVSASGTCGRLRRALMGMSANRTGWADLGSLIRQILLEDAAHRQPKPLQVPTGSGWPTTHQWDRLHCTAMPKGPGHLLVSAQLWHPAISEHESTAVALEDMRSIHDTGAVTRQHRTLPADPFWSQSLRYTSYLSLGQRQAARTIALAPPGSTCIVCLPTGQGKTDLILAQAFGDSSARSVSVIVVPTVVLALDMERRVRALLDRRGEREEPQTRYAYTSGVSNDDKERIRSRVRTGSQRVLFASPEAVFSSPLRHALDDAAASGYLHFLVVDEAHLVEQWGNDFRPDFQILSSLRRGWVQNAPEGCAVRTVVMSATLTERQISTLAKLFSEGAPAKVLAAALRHEPSFYVQQCTDEKVREGAVLAAARMGSRPMAIYATKKSDVQRWAKALRASGHLRVAELTGDSDEAQRTRVIAGWGGQTPDYDIVVGTSAFGLGVDVPDVRTVIHACIPESIDRFYQEVGRGGRQGSPSVSLLLTAPGDDATAAGLNTPTLIGNQLGWDRWQRLLHTAHESSNVLSVDLDALRSGLPMPSGENRKWNIRTLNLMSAADLVRLWPDDTSPEKERVNTTGVQIIDSSATNRNTWTARIRQERSALIDDVREGLLQMRQVVDASRCIGEILSDYYRTPTRLTCRGCPACRAHGHGPRTAADPHPAVHPWPVNGRDPLSKWRGTATWLSIWWHDDIERRDLFPQLLARLSLRGMVIAGGPGLPAALLGPHLKGSPLIHDIDGDLLGGHTYPMTWVLNPNTVGLDAAISARLRSQDITYLVHDKTLRMWDDDRKLVKDSHPQSISLATALGDL